MPDLEKYDIDFRPRSYFISEATKAKISRIKGSIRQDFVRDLGISGVDDETSSESLSEEELQAVGLVNPALMGGEFLPDYDDAEVEIARLQLESVTYDVISLRARRVNKKIHYRLVDEYETEYEINPSITDKPLTFRELIEIINGAAEGGLPRYFKEYNYEVEGDAEGLKDFVQVSSEFYPELEAYYREEAEEWVNEKLMEEAEQERRKE